MIRFVLKSAFFLGLVAMFLPGLSSSPAPTADGPETSVDLFSTMIGAQAAITDLSGFCERAPSACLAGSEIARFAAARIGEGIAVASTYVAGAMDDGGTGPRVVAQNRPMGDISALPRDRMLTGAVERRAELPDVHVPTVAPAGFAMPSLGVGTRHREASMPPVGLPPARLPVPRPAPRA